MKKTVFYDILHKSISRFYNELVEKLLYSNETFNDEEVNKLLEMIDNTEKIIEMYCQFKLKMGRLYDYNALKNEFQACGIPFCDIAEMLTTAFSSDTDYIDDTKHILDFYKERSDYMFGYPANMEQESSMVDFLRKEENKVNLMNNCGDPYEQGNYNMDSKVIEQKIISLFAHNMGLSETDKYWGYITSGGTEGNHWGMREGLSLYPNGKLYYSQAAHYSVSKFANLEIASNETRFKNIKHKSQKKSIFEHEVIPSDATDCINKKELIRRIELNWVAHSTPAIILLTWGTTTTGSIDDVAYITQKLKAKKIPYYIHLDAALFGGIPNNQEAAPKLPNFKELNIDSISISLHKFIGASMVNGIVIAKNREMKSAIDYIGQEDTTILGSRDFPPFSTYQRANEVLRRSPPNAYRKNCEFFKSEMQKAGVEYWVEGKKSKTDAVGNTFVVRKPPDEICKKYQLADFKKNGKNWAHIILFPYHKQEIILELINDLRRS